MLSKENRLTKRKEFGFIYKHGRYSYNNFLTLIYVPTKLKTCRIGFSVNKKTGKAFERNYVKRQLREIIRAILPKIDKNYNYIFVTKPDIVSLNYTQKQTAVLEVLTKAKLIHD